jgi:hypothetical protein
VARSPGRLLSAGCFSIDESMPVHMILTRLAIEEEEDRDADD